VRLEHRAARSGDRRLAAQIIALSDERVRAALEARLSDGELLTSLQHPDAEQILFAFHPGPGRLPLHPSGVLVVIDSAGERVVHVDVAFDFTGQPLFDAAEEIRGGQGQTADLATPELMLSAGAKSLDGVDAMLERVSTTVQTSATLSGTFFHGRISVENVTIPLFKGAGTAPVTFVPPTVDITVLLGASAPATYKWSVTINGRAKSGSGTIPGGKHSQSFSFPFSDFGIAAPAGVA